MISLLRSNPITFLMVIPCVLFSLTIHEYAHGYTAYRCGDSTAKNLGRLTLNPMKHLDPVGTLMMLFIGFGYAKPVPVIPRNFRKPKRDMVLVSFAGPVSNFILALAGSVIYFILLLLFCRSAAVSSADMKSIINFQNGPAVLFNQSSLFSINDVELSALQSITLEFFSVFTFINAGLGVFNLIPLPPLDGSKILSGLLPGRLGAKYLQIEKYTQFVLMGSLALAWVVPAIGDIIWLPIEWLRNCILYLYQFVMLLLF